MRAFIFPGQGSQAVGMGAALAEASRAARDVFDEVDEALGQNLFRLMRDGPEDELRLTENAQPAIMAHSIAVFRALTRDGGVELRQGGEFRRRPQPRRIFGAVRGGLVRPRDHRQAAEAARAGDAGGGAGRRRARWRRCSARISRWRRRSPTPRPRAKSAPSPTTMTRARSSSRATRARSTARSRWPRTWAPSAPCLLPVSAPFHCPLMQPAAEAMRDALSYVVARSARGAALRQCHRRSPETDPDTIRNQLVEQVTGMVRWRESVANMAAAGVERIRRTRRQGARPDGQAHRARREGDERRHDRRHRSAGEGDCVRCST